MNRYHLESKVRSVGLAYVLLFLAGAHYAYLNKWGTQILFWITFGGLGIWWFIDIFRVPEQVYEFNEPIFEDIDWLEREKRERDDFRELRRMRAERSGNLLHDQWK